MTPARARSNSGGEAAESSAAERLVRAAVAGLEERGPLLLAVSGGLDSMALLDACAAWLPSRVAAVATFDHGTGEAATAASALVDRVAAGRGLTAVVARAGRTGATEAEWREARWSFLRRAAAERRATVVTAHTADDQAETVFMRILRGAGARGLAALRAPGPVARPFVMLSRSTLARYARDRGLSWVDDPSNLSRDHLRNRVRLDLLPAVERVRPGFTAWLIDLGERAAAWRADLDELLSAFAPRRDAHGALVVAAERLSGYDAESLGVLWPALAARAGATLDRRGTRRLAEFSISGPVGGRVQLSGGFEVVRRRHAFVLRRSAVANGTWLGGHALRGTVTVGPWRFRPVESAEAAGPQSVWSMPLPAAQELTVRPWRPGDRMRVGGGRLRRVKRMFSEAGVPGTDRAGWPVVLAAGEIVWIPGVRRGEVAPETLNRTGRPLWYLCERHYRTPDAGEHDG